MPYTTVNGVRLYYEIQGESGEPLVLVHGYTGDISDWRHQLPAFSRTHRVLIMDHRGHGRSEAPADRASYTIEQMADDVEAIVALAGFERYHLLGHSMGGAVVQEIALRSPARLLSLTLHDTSASFGFRREDSLAARHMELRNRVAQEQGMAAVADMPSPFKPLPHQSPERRADEKTRLSAMSVDGFIGGSQALRTWRGAADRIGELRIPTLVICGELDMMLIGAAQKMAATIRGAVLEIIPEAGHSPQFERPELFNAALHQHLERNAGAAPK